MSRNSKLTSCKVFILLSELLRGNGRKVPVNRSVFVLARKEQAFDAAA